MVIESKWTKRFWAVVTLLAAAVGGGAGVKVMIGSGTAPAQPKAAVVQPVKPPCYQSPPTCGTSAKW